MVPSSVGVFCRVMPLPPRLEPLVGAKREAARQSRLSGTSLQSAPIHHKTAITHHDFERLDGWLGHPDRLPADQVQARLDKLAGFLVNLEGMDGLLEEPFPSSPEPSQHEQTVHPPKPKRRGRRHGQARDSTYIPSKQASSTIPSPPPSRRDRTEASEMMVDDAPAPAVTNQAAARDGMVFSTSAWTRLYVV